MSLAEKGNLRLRTVSSVCPYINILVGDSVHKALVDSGSACSLISSRLFEAISRLGLVKHTEESSLTCWTASNSPLPISRKASIKFKVECFSWVWSFLVAQDLSMDCILGADFIQKTGLVLDLQAGQSYFRFNRRVSVPFSDNFKSTPQVGEVECEEGSAPGDPFGHLDEEQAGVLRELCSRFPEVLTPKLGSTHLIEYEIRLTDTQPVRSHPYKLAPPKMEVMRGIIKDLLDQGVIEPSNSSYASPAFLVPKPNGKHRMVVDLRKLNAKIEIDSVPLPDLHSAFDWFGKAKFFTIFDLNQAYHQIPLKKESRPLTAFCVPWNLYQYRSVPMGLAVGAQTLTRLLDSIFHDVKFKYVFNYLDDLLVYSESFTEHVKHLEEVLVRLGRAGLTVNPEKVSYAKSEISFLGHLVSSRGVSIDPARTQGIRDFPPPKDAKGVARFIGMVNFYRRFIPDFAEVAAPLNALRRKDAKFVWGEDQERAFQLLREAIIQPPVLRIPDFSRPFILQTDSSSCAVGAVLSQEFDGARQPIAFASRTLTLQEKKSSIYELECLAVVFGMDKFRRFLEHSEFLLETDNQALSWLLAHPRQLGKIGRWVVKIAAFKFRVQHIRGTQNVVADALSRMYHLPSDPVDSQAPLCGTVMLDFPAAFESFGSHQLQDPELSNIIGELQEGEAHSPYFLSKGVLCCRARRGGGPKIVLPSALIPMVFSYFHVSPVGGHLGIHKTIAKIRDKFIWKSMDRDIAGRVRACHLCSVSKPAQNTKLGLLSSEVAERPLEKVFIDYVGPFPRSKSGNTSLLVAVDAFSKFCWLIPLRSATASLTVKALKSRLLQNFGVPATFVSDNGTQFVSREFHRFCFGHGIKHVTTSPYYPQPSHAERFNRNLRAALIAYHAEKQTTWDENLSWLQLAFNSALHESHDSTPFQVMFSRPPSDPLSNLWSLDSLLPVPGTPNVSDTWEAVRVKLLQSRERVRRKFNKGRIANPFQVGDLVFCKAHPVSSAVDKRAAKLCYRWTGPHR
uniref:RNA-directed DNA polymerase n=1 Tax=Homalodisca liturata TaxID=320908 RepID=A0A1B6JZN4_9HEMI